MLYMLVITSLPMSNEFEKPFPDGAFGSLIQDKRLIFAIIILNYGFSMISFNLKKKIIYNTYQYCHIFRA